MTDWAYDWVILLIDWGGYVGVFLLMLLETVFPPIPSEVVLPIAGMRAANGPLGLPGVIIASTLGTMTGNFLWYLAARSVGLDRFRYFITRYGRWITLDWYDVERVQNLFGRFGPGIVFVGRMLPTIRTFISVPAGIVRMGLGPFLIWSTVGTALFAAALAGAGYAAGSRFREIEEIAGPVSSAVIVGIIFWYVWRQATWESRRAKRADARAGTHP
ncbi:MAG: DedA family protein [Sphingosinicella sp.]|uniref:DedA family protein n=1 Tax=Sphingosinicella sp. TaxID=1917971 RepID=UPI0040381C0F